MKQTVSQKLSSLWKHRIPIFWVSLALLAAFCLGWYAHYAHEDAQWDSTFYADLYVTRYALTCIQHLYTAVDDQTMSIQSGASFDIVQMRECVSELKETLTIYSAAVRDTYPEAISYLNDLSYYLLEANYSDYASFGPTLAVGWPLMDASYASKSLDETLASIEDRLCTEKGREALALLSTNGQSIF